MHFDLTMSQLANNTVIVWNYCITLALSTDVNDSCLTSGNRRWYFQQWASLCNGIGA